MWSQFHHDSNLYQGSTYPLKKRGFGFQSHVGFSKKSSLGRRWNVETTTWWRLGIPGIPGSARSPWALQGFGWWVGSWWGLGRSGSLWDSDPDPFGVPCLGCGGRMGHLPSTNLCCLTFNQVDIQGILGWKSVRIGQKQTTFPVFVVWGCLKNSVTTLKSQRCIFIFLYPIFQSGDKLGGCPISRQTRSFHRRICSKGGIWCGHSTLRGTSGTSESCCQQFWIWSKLTQEFGDEHCTISMWSNVICFFVAFTRQSSPAWYKGIGLELLWKHCLLFPPNTTKGFWVPVLVKQLRIIVSW